MGIMKAAIGDGVITLMWIFCASSLGAVTYVVASALGVAAQGPLPSLLITTLLLTILLFIFGFIADFLGGATFNPTATAAFYAAGVDGGDHSLVSAAIRFPAQAAGAVGGVLAIMEVMPMQYKHMLGGPSLLVDLHTGAMAEGILTFTITFAVLLIVLRGPNNPLIKNCLLAVSTVALILAGSTYTGPSMNPANSLNAHLITRLRILVLGNVQLRLSKVIPHIWHLAGHTLIISTIHGSNSMFIGSVPSLEQYWLHGSSVFYFLPQQSRRKPERHKGCG
ncbi:hypothetical protein BUALT_Bualt14G0000300 [Buddleja alternifolia]|uniref:Uncharacterized protein n=1 Tax=Buddleja alternifolia TaxID=168488 RepID=A0AAV6WMT3_9LAMI|nr:hypothetical protein BUALT_Bualt14G0000300 [Buddleja alternifolia]